MEKMEIFSVKMCWGNFAFDYVHSDSVGNSGGILCVWDPSSYRKKDVTVSDYFIMIRGVWLKTGCDLLIVSVYAPQELNEKKMLWDYLTHVINNWKGEVIIMGDFNEVRCKSERFGSNFNVQGANVFNSFIVNAGLEEIPLGELKLSVSKDEVKRAVWDCGLIKPLVQKQRERIGFKWKNCVGFKEKGDLGVSSLIALNRGLMFKLGVEVLYSNTSLWVWGYQGDTWRRWEMAVGSGEASINLLNCMQMKLGNGDKTAFWEDIWIGHIVLKDLYPRIYALETCKFVKVGTKLTQSSLDFSFRRKPRGGIEQEQYEALLVQSDMLDDKMLPDVTTKTRWIKLVPIKVNVHAWKVKIDSLPTRFNISRRDISEDISIGGNITYIEQTSYEDWLNWLGNLSFIF
ncbi:RNA-directed DNA polymerase, eukaryota [Tanacetum coccineum]